MEAQNGDKFVFEAENRRIIGDGTEDLASSAGCWMVVKADIHQPPQSGQPEPVLNNVKSVCTGSWSNCVQIIPDDIRVLSSELEVSSHTESSTVDDAEPGPSGIRAATQKLGRRLRGTTRSEKGGKKKKQWSRFKGYTDWERDLFKDIPQPGRVLRQTTCDTCRLVKRGSLRAAFRKHDDVCFYSLVEAVHTHFLAFYYTRYTESDRRVWDDVLVCFINLAPDVCERCEQLYARQFLPRHRRKLQRLPVEHCCHCPLSQLVDSMYMVELELDTDLSRLTYSQAVRKWGADAMSFGQYDLAQLQAHVKALENFEHSTFEKQEKE